MKNCGSIIVEMVTITSKCVNGGVVIGMTAGNQDWRPLTICELILAEASHPGMIKRASYHGEIKNK